MVQESQNYLYFELQVDLFLARMEYSTSKQLMICVIKEEESQDHYSLKKRKEEELL